MRAHPDRHLRRARRFLAPLLLIAAGAWLARAPMPGVPVLVDLGTLGPGHPKLPQTPLIGTRSIRLTGSGSHAEAINDRGQVVGWYEGSEFHRRAFLWEDGKMRDLGTLGGKRSYARDVNNRGQVVGGAAQRNEHVRPFLWENGKMRDLGALPGFDTGEANAINERGQVVGASSKIEGQWMTECPFLWQAGRMEDLDAAVTRAGGPGLAGVNDINDQGDICGSASVDDPAAPSWRPGWRPVACLFSGGKLRLIGDAVVGKVDTEAAAMNNTGTTLITDDIRQGYAWSADQLAPWSSGLRGEAFGLNDHGAIVGSIAYLGNRHAAAYRNGRWIDLALVRRFGPRLDLIEAHDINNRGQIVGDGRTPAGEKHAFLLSGVRLP